MRDLKNIKPVLQYTEFIDAVLSKTQRKTPTVVRKKWPIQRIREFYIKKIKFIGNEYNERLEEIINSFPRIEELHPFFGDLVNVLYDKDVYKKALGHVSSIKKVVKDICNEYLRLSKYGDSLYRCKQLKISCFGRMTSSITKMKPTLEYLEKVRQHIGRLPDINPNKRTIILCGLPNVGKSSLMKTMSNTKVEVQNYAFTTKALYVGHFEDNYIPFQLIDTPGLLDHSISEMNNIELQTVTALAHLKAVVLFLIDPTQECGYSLESQIKLYEAVAPLLQNEILIAISKFDAVLDEDSLIEEENFVDSPSYNIENLVNSEKIVEENKKVLVDFLKDKNFVCFSSRNGTNTNLLKKKACEIVLKNSLPEKLNKLDEKLNMIDVKQPETLKPKGENHLRTEEIVTEKQKEREHNLEFFNLNASKDFLRNNNYKREEYIFDERKIYLTAEEEKFDIIPEFYNGKNIADYVEKGNLRRANSLLEEERQRVYRSDYNLISPEEKEMIEKIKDEIRFKQEKKNIRTKNPISKDILDNVKAKLATMAIDRRSNPVNAKVTKTPVRKEVAPKCERDVDKSPKHLFVRR